MEVHMRRQVFLLLAVLTAVSVVSADEFDTLKSEFEAAQEKFWELPDSEKVTEPSAAFMARFRQLAEKHAGSPVELKSFAFILQKSRPSGENDGESSAHWAIKQLSEKHAGNAALGEVLQEMWFGFMAVGRKPMVEFYERVIRENKEKDVLARAKLSLVTTLRRANEHGDLESKPQKRPADEKRSTELFREIVAQHEGTDAAKSAARYLFEIEKLQVGMKAPDFAGNDVEGKTVRLSDFKGRVVYLDFWGFW
jgi:hypothetical protein